MTLKTIYPPKLAPGDEIRVIAPSSSGSSIKADVKKRAIARAQSLGFKVSFGKHVSEKDIMGGSSIVSRVADLHDAFRDPAVKAIFAIRGGYNANTLLPYLDWELIKKNPKPLIGYSDITVLTNAIYAKTGVVAYSGPNFSTLGKKDEKGEVEYVIGSFEQCLMQELSYEVTPSKYFNERTVGSTKNKGMTVVQSGTAEGTIVGGHLSTLNLLQGTDYMPSIKNSILFLEDDDFGGENTPFEFERNLESLLQLPGAETIRGIVFGRFQKGSKMTLEKLRFLLSSKKLPQNIPLITGADFGHTVPMMTLPIGGTTRIVAKGIKVTIEIVKH